MRSSLMARYRAWDGKRMYYEVQKARLLPFHGPDVELYGTEYTHQSSIDFTDFGSVLETAKDVMQFIGRIDTNMIPIFVGDIIRQKVQDTSENEGNVMFEPTFQSAVVEVFYCTDCCMFQCRLPNIKKSPHWGIGTDCVVIGHIYETQTSKA
jgi:hypothetical protein